MSAVEVVQFPATGQDIRATFEDGEPWLVASDVCAALGLNHVGSALRRVSDRFKGVRRMHTPGGLQNVTVVNEQGAYMLVMRSDKPEALAFQEWLADLAAQHRRAERAIPSHAESLRGWAAEVEAREAAERRASLAETKVFELEPVAAQAEHFRQADGLYAIAQLCNDLALHAREKYGVKLLHEQIRDFLGEIGMVIRSKSIRRNEPTATALKSGWMRPKHSTIERSTGPQDKVSARLTTKGWAHAWDRAVARLAAHGSLDKPKDVEKRSA